MIKKQKIFSALFAPMWRCGDKHRCVSSTISDGVISFKSTGGREAVGFSPSVFLAQDEEDYCSPENQISDSFNPNDDDGYTRLQLFLE